MEIFSVTYNQIFIYIIWDSQEQQIKYENNLIILVKKYNIFNYQIIPYSNSLDYEGSEIWFTKSCKHRDIYIKNLTEILNYINDNNIKRKLRPLPFCDGSDLMPGDFDDVSYGYIILKDLCIILSYIDKNGESSCITFKLDKIS